MSQPLVKSEGFTTCLIMLSSEETDKKKNSELFMIRPVSQTELIH